MSDETLKWIARQDQLDAAHRDYVAGRAAYFPDDLIERFRVAEEPDHEYLDTTTMEFAEKNWGPFTPEELTEITQANLRHVLCTVDQQSFCDPESYQGDHTYDKELANGKTITLHK